MKLPLLNELPTTRQTIEVFGGYNHNLRIGEGEFYDMKNLTSTDYPVLSPRTQRGIYASPNNPQGMIEKETLCYVDGTEFVINDDTRIDLGLSTKEEDCPKTLVSMGAYVIIMPDKKYINTKDYSDRGNIEETLETSGETTFELCKIDGSAYKEPPAQDTAPQNPKDTDLWLDTSSIPHTLKQYSTINSTWVSIATTYIKITFSDVDLLPFSAGDGITISGLEETELSDLNDTAVIQEVGENYIVIIGIIKKKTTLATKITFERLMPAMDFIIESENRLWGCRYGEDINGNVVNEIYASKLGDFKNWNCFAGISTDSYVATVGTDGQFTGAVTHLGYPIFFKENCMHKVYGNYPANYQIQTTHCRGVQKNCSKSLVIVNEILYYKARSAVCVYDGSLPVEISSAFGDMTYTNAVAGTVKNKYYISMMDNNGEYQLFVYDTKRGLWHKEDNTHVLDFCTYRGELYYIDAKNNQIKTILGSGTPDKSPINWMAESGIIGTDLPDKKYISRLDVRMKLTVGTRVYFYIEYDSCGQWEHLFTMTGIKLQSFPISIRPRRCDHMRIRIEGDGEAKIFSICKTIEQGSDV
jgi:hypothetical protein